jgi:hypothetical protein
VLAPTAFRPHLSRPQRTPTGGTGIRVGADHNVGVGDQEQLNLGERQRTSANTFWLRGMEEVRGSIPLRSTNNTW